MHFFHKNKSQPSLPEIYEAGGEDDGVQQGVNARLPVRYSLVIPSTQSPQSLYAYANDQPAQQHQQQQSQPQQLQHYEDSYTHPAHAVSRFSDERSDSPPTLSQQQAGKPVLNLVPTSPTLALGSASDLSSNEHPYTPQSPEPVPLVEAPQPRKLRKGLFGLSSKDKNKDKEKDASFRSSKVLGRSISVRRKAGQTFPEHRKSNGQPFDSAADSKAEQTTENRMPLHSKKSPQPPAPPYASTLNHSSSNIESQLFEPSRIQRVSTEPLSQESYPQRQSQAQLYPDGFQHPAVLHPKLQIDQAGPWQPGTQYHFGGSQAFADEPSNSRSQSPQLDPHLTPRPPSQQSFGPPSPLNPHYQGFESNQHKFHFRQSLQPPTGPAVPLNQSGMERQTGLRQPSETAPPGQISQSQTIQPPNLTPGNSFKSGLGQSGSKEPDRDTPPPPPAKGRDDTDIDVRALNQKYEELRTSLIFYCYPG